MQSCDAASKYAAIFRLTKRRSNCSTRLARRRRGMKNGRRENGAKPRPNSPSFSMVSSLDGRANRVWCHHLEGWQLTDDAARRWAWVQDGLTVAGLWFLAGGLFFARGALTLSMDGFYISYAKFSGQLRAFDILDAHRLKESGRPFVGLVWHLATLLTGGTVDGYSSCLLVLHASTATIV